jgi:hypothetical protein
MRKYAGKEAKIIAVGNNYYDLDIDKGKWGWDEWMLEDAGESRHITECKLEVKK